MPNLVTDLLFLITFIKYLKDEKLVLSRVPWIWTSSTCIYMLCICVSVHGTFLGKRSGFERVDMILHCRFSALGGGSIISIF